MVLKKIEEKAEEVLESFGIRTVPIPIEEVATKCNIQIGRAPSKDFSGLLIRKDGYALIGVNSSESLVRQRFTVAHELGHFFLHPNKNTFIDYRDNKERAERTPKEVQANMFAAALLMPRKKLEKDFRSIAKNGFLEEHLFSLAEKYNVSKEAMQFRLINLNLSA